MERTQGPPPEHTNASWNYVSPEAAQARAETKEAKKKDAAQKKAAKAAEKKASNPPKKKKAAKSTAPKKKARTSKKAGRSLPEFPGFPAHYPPAGHLIDFNWGDGWHEGKFLKIKDGSRFRGG